METGGLKNLIELGLKPRRGIPGLILAHFSEIVEARELGWTWRDIAKAMGRSGDEKALSTTFWRIKKWFESGKLKILGKDQQNSRKEKKKESLSELPEKKEKKPFRFERAGDTLPPGDSNEDFFERHRIDKQPNR